MKIHPVGTTLSVSISDCPRCKGTHSSLMCIPFEEMISGGYTHYATCGSLNKPILIRVLGETDMVFGNTLEKLSR